MLYKAHRVTEAGYCLVIIRLIFIKSPNYKIACSYLQELDSKTTLEVVERTEPDFTPHVLS